MSSLCSKVYYEWPFTPIPFLGPFEKWGIDFMGPLPVIKRRH
jgi:hypothetical protein